MIFYKYNTYEYNYIQRYSLFQNKCHVIDLQLKPQNENMSCILRLGMNFFQFESQL